MPLTTYRKVLGGDCKFCSSVRLEYYCLSNLDKLDVSTMTWVNIRISAMLESPAYRGTLALVDRKTEGRL